MIAGLFDLGPALLTLVGVACLGKVYVTERIAARRRRRKSS